MTTVNQGMSVEEIERVVAQRVANAIEAIAIYKTKTNMARKSMSQTERQEDKVAENASNKRKWEGNHNGSSSQQNKGHKVPRAHTTRPINKKAYAGSLPLCNQCKFHHNGPCTVKCGNCKKVGHITRNCRTPTTARNQRTLTCYECGSLGHYKSNCPIVKFQNRVDMSKKEHEEHLKAILELLKKEELYTKIFLSVNLGFPKYSSSVTYSSIVKSCQLLQNKFIEGFSGIAKSMTKLTQKGVKFDWGDKQEASFQLLKQKLCSTSILALPEGNKDFVVYCDASHKGLEFGDSYKVPPEEPGKAVAGEAFAKKKGRTVAITTKDMQKRRNDEAILKTFGGNEATKKTKKNQLKQQYGNFKAKGSETLEQTFNRLQAIRNRDDLDTMSLDDLYNHLKVYEPEVQKKAGSNSQNMAFISSSNTSGKGEVPTTSVPTASSQVSTVSIEIDEDDIDEMDIKWNLALLSMRADRFWKKTSKKITIQGSDVAGFDKSKVECFNCHKMGHFARECRAPRSQDRGKRESYRKDPKVEEPAPKALMAIDGIGWDWSYMANEDENHALVADDVVPTEFALMAMSSSSSSSDNEVYDDSYCSKSCRKNTENLNTKINKLNEELSDCETDLYNYKRGLSQVEARLVEFKVNETKFCERIRVLERDVEIRDNKIESLKNELEELKKEKESIDHKLAGFGNASKDLNDLLESQKSAKDKTGVGFNEYTVVPPPPAQVYSPPQRDLSWTGLPEFVDDTVTDYTRPTPSVDVSKDVRS
ncbi:putative ribonuclease H-like domain-containing protein, partial [Tanacetum coccineum]